VGGFRVEVRERGGLRGEGGVRRMTAGESIGGVVVFSLPWWAGYPRDPAPGRAHSAPPEGCSVGRIETTTVASPIIEGRFVIAYLALFLLEDLGRRNGLS